MGAGGLPTHWTPEPPGARWLVSLVVPGWIGDKIHSPSQAWQEAVETEYGVEEVRSEREAVPHPEKRLPSTNQSWPISCSHPIRAGRSASLTQSELAD